MFDKKLSYGYGVFFISGKKTSGQRFFSNLNNELKKNAIPIGNKPKVILFNISAPFKEIVKAKIRRQKVVLRVDGLYYDRLSVPFLKSFIWPLRLFFSLGIKHPSLHNFLAHIANFVNQNYGGFSKIYFADELIYQSKFSRDVYNKYFPNKPYNIIVNGSNYILSSSCNQNYRQSGTIKLITIYNDRKPQKRMAELVDFVCWVSEVKKLPIILTVLGYTGNIPRGADISIKQKMENSSFIRTLPTFREFNGETIQVFNESDMYITFSNRDACPNVVVEAMAHGLPVVGLQSGGLPDIVGEAGILLPEKDNIGFFAPSRYEAIFPPIDNEAVLSAILQIRREFEAYRTQVHKRFKEELQMEVVAKRYATVLEKSSEKLF